MDVTRRKFLGALAAATVPLTDSASGAAQALLRRQIPGSGESLTAVGLGTWQSFDIAAQPGARPDALATLRELVSGGGQVVDCSPMYGSAESVVGQLASELAITTQLFVATKVWTQGREAGIAQMHESLNRLRVERCDLMQVHNLVDADIHLATLREWQQSGRVRYVGVTHYHAHAHAQLERTIKRGGVDFLQVNYSLVEPQAADRLLPLARERGVAVIVNRPFAEGGVFARLRGKELPAWAVEVGCGSWAQYFLKWILAHPAVTCVIPGTRNPRHMADNLAAAGGAMPDAELRERMARHFAGL